jgi:hypothetical protein
MSISAGGYQETTKEAHMSYLRREKRATYIKRIILKTWKAKP